MTDLENSFSAADIPAPIRYFGRVEKITDQSVHVSGLNHRLGQGALIEIEKSDGTKIRGEVIALEGTRAMASLYSSVADVKIGQRVEHIQATQHYPSNDWIGKILDYEGRCIDGSSPARGSRYAKLDALPPSAILRKALGPRINTGVAALDTFLPLCQGQRTGLFAGSGVGKSTLLGTIARANNADVTVIALIGERGREVRHFVEKVMGPEGMKKSIVFVATSDMSAAIKLRTAQLAITTAEFFRDEGKQVLFLFDSLTRYAEAHRTIALNAGEVPALKAYPPSTFRALAALCERSGPGLDNSGDITAVFSVLVAGSNMEEPVADMVRGILDGHVVLSREIAERGRYPAFDIRRSVSRSLPDAASAEENKLLQTGREYIMRYEEAEPILQAGLYVSGSDPKLDKAIAAYPALDSFIGTDETLTIDAAFEKLGTALNLSPETEAETAPT